MVLLFISIFLFNLIALIKNKIPSIRIVSIWTFSIAFQLFFDVIVEIKYSGYWYFDKGVDWIGILAHTVLIPPVNILLLNWFPFNSNLFKQAIYITCWTVGVIAYEALVLLPEPWGFFHLGWWKLWCYVLFIPILILIILGYYKVICKLEKNLLDSYKEESNSDITFFPFDWNGF